jgi:hypothetical protein
MESVDAFSLRARTWISTNVPRRGEVVDCDHG